MLLFIGGATLLQRWQLTNQLYHSEIQDMETAEGLLYFSPSGSIAMHEEYHNRLEDKLRVSRLMQVMAPDGRILYQNDNLKSRDLGRKPFPGEGFHVYNPRRMRLADGTPVLLISHVHSIDSHPLLIRIGYGLNPLNNQVFTSLGILLVAFFPTMLLAAFGGYRVAVKALQPLEEMAITTEQITAESLGRRLPGKQQDDEMGHMARILNGLLARLEASFDQLKRFTADASHELRTPLACLRTTGELSLQKEQTAEQYRETIASMLEEVDRLTQLIERLLLISRADAGQIGLSRTIFPLMELIEESSGMIDILAEEKHQQIEISGDRALMVWADRAVLRHAVLNLMENAVKYSPSSGLIRIHLKRCDDQFVEVAVEDQGPGIPEGDRDRIFDRFFRVDSARSREEGGAGLGLAIAQWAVRANGGSIGLSAKENPGCRFFIRLPTP